jgi:hypothetical protein
LGHSLNVTHGYGIDAVPVNPVMGIG